MRILQFIMGKADPNRANGVNRVIYEVSTRLQELGHEVVVIGLSPGMKEDTEIVDRGKFSVEAFRSFSCGAFPRIRELAGGCDIVHMHGAWNYHNTRVASYLSNTGIPYLITPHAGLSEDRMRQSHYWLKRIYHVLFQRKVFDRAAGIHAISREESTDIARFTENRNIFLTPNGVDMEKMREWKYSLRNRDCVKLGYLGRLSPEKNLGSLIKSLTLLPEELREKISLHLIGPADSSEALILKEFVKDLDLERHVFFPGASFGEEKLEKLLELDIYIHPACSEAGSISLIEVLAMGIPSIITRTSHVSYYYDSQSFVMVEPTASDLCRGIVEMLNKRSHWGEISENSQNLANWHFDIRKTVKCLAAAYENMISSH